MFEPDDGDYWRDGVVMYIVDDVDIDALAFAAMYSENGEEFNTAIWAEVRLDDLVSAHYCDTK